MALSLCILSLCIYSVCKEWDNLFCLGFFLRFYFPVSTTPFYPEAILVHVGVCSQHTYISECGTLTQSPQRSLFCLWAWQMNKIVELCLVQRVPHGFVQKLVLIISKWWGSGNIVKMRSRAKKYTLVKSLTYVSVSVSYTFISALPLQFDTGPLASNLTFFQCMLQEKKLFHFVKDTAHSMIH